MKREQLDRTVAEEALRHIPKRPEYPAQQDLRMLFNMRRQRDLGRDPTTPKGETLRYAIDFVKKDCKDFESEYDKDYFAVR